jgi:hypothetical protein
MKNLLRILIQIFIAFIGIIVWYLIISLLYWNLNIGQWHYIARIFLVIMIICVIYVNLEVLNN